MVAGNGKMLIDGQWTTTGEFMAQHRANQLADPDNEYVIVEQDDYALQVKEDERKQIVTDSRKLRGTNVAALRDEHEDGLQRKLYETAQQHQTNWSLKVDQAARKLSAWKKANEVSI